MNRRSILIILIVIIALIMVPGFTAVAQDSNSGGSSFPISGNALKFTLIAFAGSLVGYWQARKNKDTPDE